MMRQTPNDGAGSPLRGVRVWSALLLWILSVPLSAAEEITDLLRHNWFEIEFMVFERSAVMEHNSEEELIRRERRRYPQTLTSLDPLVGLQPPDNLDLMTRLCLNFPTLEYTSTLREYQVPAIYPELADSVVRSYDDFPPAAEPAAMAPPVITPRLEPGGLRQLLAAPPPVITPRLESSPLLELLSAVARFEELLLRRSNQWQAPEHLQLGSQARRLQRRGAGRLLFHGRWLQAVPPRELPVPMLVQAGYRGDGTWELEGTVAATLARYLHFETTLYYQAPALGFKPMEVVLGDAGPASTAAALADDTEALTPGYMLLAEQRRMRSEEIHYLDHPKLGLVVRIDPVLIPEALTLALQEVQELRELQALEETQQ